MGRGPSYPYVDLEEAVRLTRKVYEFSRRSAAPIESVVTGAWGYSAKSSSGQKVLAALKAYGLLEEVSGGNGKSVKISDRAYRILVHEQNSPERLQALREAAVSPRAYALCWEKWGAEMPASMRASLLLEHDFVESTIDEFLAGYRKTVEYAKLAELDVVDDLNTGADEAPPARPPQIGDFVQWTSQGVDQFKEARRVRSYADKQRNYIFVEGSDVGVPVAELTVVPAPHQSTGNNTRHHEQSSGGDGRNSMRREIFALPQGNVLVEYPSSLSQENYEDLSDWLDIILRKIKRSVDRETANGNNLGSTQS